jgi:hypothetical protein
MNRENIFKPIIDRWYNGEAAKIPGAKESDYYDEEAYLNFYQEFQEHGVDDFIEFLHSTLCIYPSANKFLIECLAKAQDHGWDT